MSEYLSDQLAVATNIDVRFNTTVVGVHGDQCLEQVVLDDSDANTRITEATGGLFVLIGGEPRTDWLPDDIARDSRGYVVTGHDLADRIGTRTAAPAGIEPARGLCRR